MKRELVFGTDDRDARRFGLLRTALLQAGDGKGPRGIEVIRKEARLLDALDAVSVPDPVDGDPDHRKLRPEASSVQIDQPDFALLADYVAKVIWFPKVARDVVDLVDWLETAPKKSRDEEA